MKKKEFIILIIAVAVAISVLYFFYTKTIYSSFISDDGQLYMYLEHDSLNYLINNIETENGEASIDKLIGSFSNNSVDVQPLGEIATAEDAAKKGAYVLNQYYENWTCDNHIVVIKDNKENIWLVHGQVEQRGSEEKLGIVVFDAGTGKVLGYDMVKPD